VDGLLAKYSRKLAEQEVHGRFVNLAAGMAFYEFARETHVSDEFDYDPELPLVHTWDFNVNPLCSAIIQPSREGVIFVIDEIHIEGSARTRDATEEFIRRYGRHRSEVRIYGDASSRARNTASMQTDFDVIESEYRPVFGDQLSINLNYSNPSQFASVTDVNCLLRNSLGEIRLKIHPRCQYTIRDLEQVSFLPGTRNIDKTLEKQGLVHHSDALRYFVSLEHPARSEPIGGFTPPGM